MENFVEYKLTASYETWDSRVTLEMIDKMFLSSVWSFNDDELRQPVFYKRECRPRIKITGRNRGT